MLISELIVWVIAITLNTIAMIFYLIIMRPLNPVAERSFPLYPYWAIIILSCIELSVRRVYDEMMDLVKTSSHDHNSSRTIRFKREIMMIILFIIIFFVYYKLLEGLGIKIE
ncbi:MAG: hypothetical protein R3E60_07520 [Alphaproteobacteria bacterium]